MRPLPGAPLLVHLTWSSRGRLALCPTETHRRAAVRALARGAGDALLLFCVVDDHVHVVADTPSGRRLGRSVAMALAPIVAAPLDPAHLRPVADRSHLSWLVRYCLTQPQHHGLAAHPATWSGSCLADLLGARAVHPGMAGRLAAQLPRFRLRDAHAVVGLPEAPLAPAPPDRVRAAGASRLVAAAAAALAVGPELVGRGAPVVAARAAAAQLSAEAGMATAELAWALGLSPRSVRRLASHEPDPEVVDATRRQLALQDLAASSPPPLLSESSAPYPT